MISTRQIDDWFEDEFEQTEEMSTYLLAFLISNYKLVSGNTQRGVLVEVAASQEAIQNGEGDFALQEAIKILDFYENYFNVSYPLKKCSKYFKK